MQNKNESGNKPNSAMGLSKKEKYNKTIKLRNIQKFLHPLIKEITIEDILTCVTTPGYIRFLATVKEDISDIVPVLLLSYPPGLSSYSSQDGSLTLKLYNRMIAFLPPHDLGVTNTKDIEEAEEFTQILGDMINTAYEKLLRDGKPDKKEIELFKSLKWMEIFKVLPKKNCGECDFNACSAFAVSVVMGENRLDDCPLLSEEKYKKKVDILKNKYGKRLLEAIGWNE